MIITRERGPYTLTIDGVTASGVGITLNLDSCLEKLRRAREHFEAFDAQLSAFFDSNPYRAFGKVEGEDGWYVFRLQVVRKPPERIGLLVGEYVHQLRSVMDHLMWQLGWWRKRPLPPQSRGLTFPIESVQRDIDASLSRLQGNIPDDWNALVRAVQPHDRKDDPLLAIQRLWNRDKHQALILLPKADVFQFGPSQYQPNADAGGILKRIPRYHSRLEDGSEVARVKIMQRGPNPRVETYFFSPLQIGVKEGFGFPNGLLIAETLVRLLVSTFPGGEAVQIYPTPSKRYGTAITTFESNEAAVKHGFDTTVGRDRLL